MEAPYLTNIIMSCHKIEGPRMNVSAVANNNSFSVRCRHLYSYFSITLDPYFLLRQYNALYTSKHYTKHPLFFNRSHNIFR
jgi:hypothetical protein